MKIGTPSVGELLGHSILNPKPHPTSFEGQILTLQFSVVGTLEVCVTGA